MHVHFLNTLKSKKKRERQIQKIKLFAAKKRKMLVLCSAGRLAALERKLKYVSLFDAISKC